MSLTVRDARLDDAVVAVRVEDDRIVALGADVEPEAGDDVLDAAGMAVVPGLVNGHTHAAMTLMRGYGGDLPLMTWLQDRIFPIEAKLTADDVYWGTRLACVEMIRSGTVRFWDMYWQPEAVARAVQDAGIRASVALPLVDGLDADKSDALRADAERSLDALADAGTRITPTLGPHSIYLVSEKSLHWIAELSSERDLRVHIHLSETEGEVQDCAAAHGVRPAPYLDRIGLLTPRTLLAHGVWLDDDELALVGERGATVVTNPVSNLKLAVGRVFPYAKARRQGIPVGLGTDGASSNNSLDLFQDMKHLALVQKHAERDPAAMPRDRGVGGRDRAACSGPRPTGTPRGGRARPTSCSCAATRPSSRRVTSPRTSSTRPRARWSTRPSSPGGCSCAAARSGTKPRCGRARSPAPDAWE